MQAFKQHQGHCRVRISVTRANSRQTILIRAYRLRHCDDHRLKALTLSVRCLTLALRLVLLKTIMLAFQRRSLLPHSKEHP
jgi:hypothetical protein